MTLRRVWSGFALQERQQFAGKKLRMYVSTVMQWTRTAHGYTVSGKNIAVWLKLANF